MGFWEAMPPPKSPWTPLGDFRSPDPLCLPPPNPGYATESGVAVATNLERSYWMSEISYTSLDMIVVEEPGPLRPRTVGKQVSSIGLLLCTSIIYSFELLNHCQLP